MIALVDSWQFLRVEFKFASRSVNRHCSTILIEKKQTYFPSISHIHILTFSSILPTFPFLTIQYSQTTIFNHLYSISNTKIYFYTTYFYTLIIFERKNYWCLGLTNFQKKVTPSTIKGLFVTIFGWRGWDGGHVFFLYIRSGGLFRNGAGRRKERRLASTIYLLQGQAISHF